MNTTLKLIKKHRLVSPLGWTESYTLDGHDAEILIALLRLKCSCPDPKCDRTRWGIAIEYPSVDAIDRQLALWIKRQLLPHVQLLESRPDNVCFCSVDPVRLDRMLQLWETPALALPITN